MQQLPRDRPARVSDLIDTTEMYIVLQTAGSAHALIEKRLLLRWQAAITS